MGSNILPLTSGTYYIPLRQDFILLCQSLKYRKDKSKSSPHCKALILAILERWTNDKIDKNKNLFVHMTFPQWEESMYNLYKRNVIADSLDELLEEKLIQRETFKTGLGGRDQYKYLLNIEAIKAKLATVINHSSNEEPRKITDQQGKITVDTSRGTVNSNSFQAQATVKNHHGKECTNLSTNTNKGKESTPPGSTQPNVPSCTPSSSLLENLTGEERAFWDLWSGLEDIKPALNQTAYGHVKELAPLVTTIETLKSLLDYTQKKIDANERITDKTVHLGNLKNCYKGWKRIYKPAQKSIKEMSKDELIAYALSFPLRLDHHSEDYNLYHNCIDRLPPDDKKAVVKQRFEAQNKTVLWTRHIDNKDFKIDPSVWYLFEDMPLSEAQKYNYDLFGGVPGGIQTAIRTNYGREERGELKRPVLVAQ